MPIDLATLEHRLLHASNIPRLDAQVLLAHVLSCPRTWVLAHPDATLTSEQQAALDVAVQRLQGGEPLPYILGHWEFYGLDFLITPDVLIPRPETELLVEVALDWLQSHSQSQVLDVGTGSGCIAVSLAVHCSQATITATDISSAAIKVARANALRHVLAVPIRFLQADVLNFHSSIPNLQSLTFNLITANLPYIPTDTLRNLDVYGKEPTLALDGGSDGLNLVHRLLESAPSFLTKPGLILLEIEARQGKSASFLAYQHFPYAEVSLVPDLTGRDRVLKISLS